MEIICVMCGKPCGAGDYLLIGVQQGSWASQYAHRGSCEAEARERYAPKPVVAKRGSRGKAALAPVVEELTLEAAEPLSDEDALPWLGMERR